MLEHHGISRTQVEGLVSTGLLLGDMLLSVHHYCTRDCLQIARTLEGRWINTHTHTHTHTHTQHYTYYTHRLVLYPYSQLILSIYRMYLTIFFVVFSLSLSLSHTHTHTHTPTHTHTQSHCPSLCSLRRVQ